MSTLKQHQCRSNSPNIKEVITGIIWWQLYNGKQVCSVLEIIAIGQVSKQWTKTAQNNNLCMYHLMTQCPHSVKLNKGGSAWVNIPLQISLQQQVSVLSADPDDDGRGDCSPLLVVAGLSPSSSWCSLRLGSPSNVPSKSGSEGNFGMPEHRDRRRESCLLSILQNEHPQSSNLTWNVAVSD